MGILKGNYVTYPMGQEKPEHLGSGELVPDVPGVLIKPSSDGREYILRKDMYMGIHHRGKSGRYTLAFLVVKEREVRSQHDACYLFFGLK
jgi:hypothetical protein